MVRLPPRLRLATAPTPLVLLKRLSEELGGPRLWVKRDDLNGGAAAGNKLRKLEFIVAEALAEGADTLLSCGGIQSNHARATAQVGAQLGLKVHLVLRGLPEAAPPDGNLLLDRLLGAEITFLEEAEYQAHSETVIADIARDLEARGHRVRQIPTGASDGSGVWGYIGACEELARDFQQTGISPRHIITATGSGGTQAGLTAGNALFQLGAEVWGVNVCEDEAWFLAKVRQDLRDWRLRYQQSLEVESLPIRVLGEYAGPGYAKAGPEVLSVIHRLAQTEGLVLDPVYTGKAFHGLLCELERGLFGEQGDIVFIHTGGIFGLFPQREALFKDGVFPPARQQAATPFPR